MIKFQPFIAPSFPGYKYVTSTLVFDSIPEAELVEDQSIFMYRLIAQWKGQDFSCIFFIDPNSMPQVANISPPYVAQYGVLMFPEQYEEMVLDYEHVSFYVKVQMSVGVDNQASPAIDELLQELEQVMKEPEIDISPEVMQLMGEYAKIDNDKAVQTAYQCARMIEKLSIVTPEEFEMMAGLPCGSQKLSTFVLGKLRAKVR